MNSSWRRELKMTYIFFFCVWWCSASPNDALILLKKVEGGSRIFFLFGLILGFLID
jgi:hypothetical protein